eukprot:CAMPEP_0172505920 /NCGR_PEP_ID=MMETSP1066-20121228/190131_1 /TAXON_ID=671091 /ORGANISM="Coscinodiscus wailesii, Strain CCMP2513" /LENGTH=78 /DNA_ID=CAMNT_0013282697 /DNA_START=229 /DNA_END=461 /DNA_ORIENTATION=+
MAIPKTPNQHPLRRQHPPLSSNQNNIDLQPITDVHNVVKSLLRGLPVSDIHDNDDENNVSPFHYRGLRANPPEVTTRG